MKKIITISREFGAGGSTIGKKVAEELGYEFSEDMPVIFEEFRLVYKVSG